MNYITFHWTAGGYNVTDFEKQFYHYLFDSDGNIHPGKFKPEDNIPSKYGLKPGRYAAHCGGGNSYNIGIAICGMSGFIDRQRPGKHPITRRSFEAACQWAATQAKKYRIPIDAGHVFSHAEFGKRRPQSSSAGKIDICFIPWEPELRTVEQIGDYIRNKVKWYYEKL